MENEINLTQPSGQKYVMFLPERYFKSTFFENIYKKLRKNLENLGINLFCIENFIGQINKSNSNLTFDGKPIPVANQLYVHVFKNLYYSDTNYNKKRMEKEREHLFLLAGKLGVHEIKYTTEITETEITSTALDSQVANVTGTVSHKKSETKKTGMGGSEQYENRGASVYVNHKNDIKKVEEELKNLSDKSSVFSFEFYKECPNLESFVLKRCSFRMSKVEYYIESEDISELSLAVKAYFNEYGLGISYDKNILSSEKIKYELSFYDDEKLEEECVKKSYEYERGKSDPFYSIRKCYENWKNENDKKSILWEIYDYVFNTSKNCYGYLLDEEDKNILHFFNFEELFRFLLKMNPDKEEWKNFTHTEEIKDWIEDFFYKHFFGSDYNLNEKLSSFLANNYPNIEYEKLQQNIKWLNIIWTDSDEQIKQTIKNELNNNCKNIDLNMSKLSFTVTLGDNILNKGKKQNNSYNSHNSNTIKRHFEQVSSAISEEQLKIRSLFCEIEKLKLENQELIKVNNNMIEEHSKLYNTYIMIQNNYDEIKDSYDDLVRKTTLDEKDFERIKVKLEEKEKQTYSQQTEIEELKIDVVKLKTQNKYFCEDSEKRIQFSQVEIERLRADNSQLHNHINHISNELKEREHQLEKIINKTELLDIEKKHFEQLLKDTNTSIKLLKDENNNLQNELKKFCVGNKQDVDDEIEELEKPHTNKQNKKHVKKNKNQSIDS